MMTDLLPLLLYAFVGLIAGFLGGLLGIGGGLVSVPALVWIFHWLHIAPAQLLQTAIGTSLGAMVFTAASSAWSHVKQKGVVWPLVAMLAPGLVLGSILGAAIADYLPSTILKTVFGVSVSLIGIYLIFVPQASITGSITLHRSIYLLLGIGIGMLSTILGIGGGIITVPILAACGTPLRNAISTSAMTGFLIALVGATAFLFFGAKQQTQGANAGYIYLPAFIVIGIISSFAAPYGAKLAYSLPTDLLRKIFGGVLILVGLWMTFGA